MTTIPSPVSDFDAFEAAGWQRAADAYEEFFGPITDRLIDPILDDTGTTAGTRLLDVGCGPGRLVQQAADRGGVATGIDVSSAMIHRARSAHPRVEFDVGDAHRLPYADGTFDVVTANFSVLHLGRPDLAASEFVRVLRPGGRIATTTWDRPERARLFGWVLESLDLAKVRPPADIPDGPPFFRFADDPEIVQLLEQNGFEGVRVRTIAFSHRVASVDVIWTGLVEGTVRTSALIRRQPPEVQVAIRRAFDELVPRASSGTSVDIPISVKLATARRRDGGC